MKIWKPDTCECVIEEIYEGNVIIGSGQVVKKCEAHSSVSDKDLYGVLFSNPDGENKVKNNTYRILIGEDEIKDLGLEEKKINQDGTEETTLKTGIEYNWFFSGSGSSRKLNVEIKGINLPKNKKTAIKDITDRKFGTDKVIIL